MAFANFRLSRYVFPPSANGLAKFVPTLNGVWNYACKENGFPANKSNSASINMNSPTSDYFINYSCKRNDFLENKSNNTSINMNTPKSDYLIQQKLLRRTSPTFPRGSFAKGFQKTGLDLSKITGGIFDERYVLSCCIHTGRSIRGFSLPSRCSRNGRRDVESIVRHALSGLGGEPSLSSLPFYARVFQVSRDLTRFVVKLNFPRGRSLRNHSWYINVQEMVHCTGSNSLIKI